MSDPLLVRRIGSSPHEVLAHQWDQFSGDGPVQLASRTSTRSRSSTSRRACASPDEVHRRLLAASPDAAIDIDNTSVTATSITLTRTDADTREPTTGVRVDLVAQPGDTRLVVRFTGLRSRPLAIVGDVLFSVALLLRSSSDLVFGVMAILFAVPIVAVIVVVRRRVRPARPPARAALPARARHPAPARAASAAPDDGASSSGFAANPASPA